MPHVRILIAMAMPVVVVVRSLLGLQRGAVWHGDFCHLHSPGQLLQCGGESVAIDQHQLRLADLAGLLGRELELVGVVLWSQ